MTLGKGDLQKVDLVIEHLKRAKSILFITGAGLSADSNLPTYRGVGGLYDDAETADGIAIETALSGDMMRTRPEITWKYIGQIERACRDASFNRGHEVIAEMERAFPKVWVLTQNVDGFHRKAGSRNVIDIHGDIQTLLCPRCEVRRSVANYQGMAIPPRCAACDAIERPDIVLFDEILPHGKVAHLEQILREGIQMVFSIGTSSLFPYIIRPVMEARRWGVPTVEINPGPYRKFHIWSTSK